MPEYAKINIQIHKLPGRNGLYISKKHTAQYCGRNTEAVER